MDMEMDDLVDAAGMGEDEEEMHEEEEEDRDSAPALLDRLRLIVRQRLGTVENVGAVGNIEDDRTTRKPASAEGDKADDGSDVAKSVIVSSARALAQLNASTIDGDEGPGAARHAFTKTMGRLREFVLDPFKKHVAPLDNTGFARLSEQLSTYGNTLSLIQHMTSKATALRDFAKVEQDERSLGIDSKFGVNSLCLPSKLFQIATDLGLGYVNELQDESKVYLTYGTFLFLEIMYGGEEVTLGATLTNEDGDETQLEDEAKDILASFKLKDQDRGFEILNEKLRALIRRCDLEIALKAGSLHDLKKETEEILQKTDIPGATLSRVARGLELALPPMRACHGYLDRGKDLPPKPGSSAQDSALVMQGQHDRQHIIASLTFRYDRQMPTAGAAWLERTALMLTIEPPVEMPMSTATKILNMSSLNSAPAPSASAPGSSADPREGAALALLLSRAGHRPIRSDALQSPPPVTTSVHVDLGSGKRVVLRITVDNHVPRSFVGADQVAEPQVAAATTAEQAGWQQSAPQQQGVAQQPPQQLEGQQQGAAYQPSQQQGGQHQQQQQQQQQEQQQQLQSNPSYATILHYVALKPDQHAVVPTIVGLVAQQVRFNALLASLICKPHITLSRESSNDQEDEAVAGAQQNTVGTNKRPRQDSLILLEQEPGEPQPGLRHRRVLICPARRGHLLKFKKLHAANDLEEDLDSNEMRSGAGAPEDENDEEEALAQEERALSLQLSAPNKLEVLEGSESRLVVTIGPQGEVECTEMPELSPLLRETNSMPIAIIKALGHSI